MSVGCFIYMAATSLHVYSVQQHFRIAGALSGGIPRNIALLDTLIAPEQHQFEYAEETDVGGEFQIKVCTISAFDKCRAAVRSC
jgi:hypothetical protein